jgi:hypothetical protein
LRRIGSPGDVAETILLALDKGGYSLTLSSRLMAESECHEQRQFQMTAFKLIF